MASEIENWASIEHKFLKDEIKWFKAGAKLVSPSGDNINAKKPEELEKRLEHAQQVLSE